MNAAASLVVTTCKKPSGELVARAEAVSVGCGVPFEPRSRRSLGRLKRDTGAELVYVVGREREEIRGCDSELHLHPGRFYLKRADGVSHPLVRAVAPPDGPPVVWVMDATLGLAGDALHLAWALGIRIEGVEASPVVGALLEAGLPRMAGEGKAWSSAAGRIDVTIGDAVAVLEARGRSSVPVVYLDPMFEDQRGSTRDFDLFRRLAVGAPLGEALLAAAVRAASHRVVLKVPGAIDVPEVAVPAPGWNRRVRGGAVDYLVVEKVLEAPVYEAPDLGEQALWRRRQRSDTHSED